MKNYIKHDSFQRAYRNIKNQFILKGMLESYIVIAIILSVIYVLSVPFFYRLIKDALISTNGGSIIIILILGIMIAFSLAIYIGALDMIFKTII